MRRQLSWPAAGVVLAAHVALLLATGSAPTALSGNPSVPAGRALMLVSLLPGAPVLERVPLAPAASAAMGAAGIAEDAAALAALLRVQGAQESPYLLPRELSQGPQLIHDVAPDIGYLALPAGPVLSAVLRLLINEQGDVDQIQVLESQFSDEVLQEVQRAYAELKFLPARRAGRVVKSQLTIEVRLDDSLPRG